MGLHVERALVGMRVKSALLLSDLHLGWSICADQHAALLRHLPEAVGDAELVVLNGDILDFHRGQPRGLEADLVSAFIALCAQWRREGRRVVYVEGNHDTEQPGLEFRPDLKPDRWFFDWEGVNGERVRVLHGHRFDDRRYTSSHYERVGKHLLRAENHLYAHATPMRWVYPKGPGWFVGAVGFLEDVLWIRDFPARITPLLGEVDVLLHGHFHFGPSRRRILSVDTWRTGAWVSQGHLGSVDRMLRYRGGRFERIGLDAGRLRVFHDGL